MKKLLAVLFALGLAAPAFAGQPGVLVVDPDKAGTNVRDAPSGRVLDVIPYASASSPDSVKERRVVTLLANEGKWFKVAYSGGEGYVHQSMLGVCTSATEDGDPVLLKAPRDNARSLGRVADGTRARPLSFFMQDDVAYLNVEILEGPRKGTTGWLPEQAFAANPYASCWRR
ncbi:MAG: SH3 domain-containing protein [Desulfovibrio sp.]|nr:SH3 domain-containing protein [Desulfovibrio sp.]MBR6468690.1 SH3 domain-containing protein [Desulfovibrio sp.]